MKNTIPARKKLYELLSSLLESGHGAEEAVRAIRPALASGARNIPLHKLTLEVEKSTPFSEIIPLLFPDTSPLECAALKAGETSGKQGQVMQQLAQLFHQRINLTKDLLENLQGPVLSLHSAIFLYALTQYINGGWGPHTSLSLVFLLILLWIFLYIVGRQIINQILLPEGQTWLPLYDSVILRNQSLQYFTSYHSLLCAGISRSEIHRILEQSLTPHKVALEKAHNEIIHETLTATCPIPFITEEDWQTWSLSRKVGKEQQQLEKLILHGQEILTRNHKTYFRWLDRILRLFLLIAVGVVLYQQAVSRMEIFNQL